MIGAYSLQWTDEEPFPQLSKHKENLTKSLTNTPGPTEGPSHLSVPMQYLLSGKRHQDTTGKMGISRSLLCGVVGDGVNLWAGNKISTYRDFHNQR